MAKTRRRSAAPASITPAPASGDARVVAADASLLSPGRRRLFAALTLALPWVLLACLELGLRAGGYGASYPLFVPYPDQPGWLFVNPDVGKRYFRGPFTPTSQVDFFRERKAPGSYRVFFQGESSAAGFPYGHGGAPSRMLAARLARLFPDRDVEVVNTALTAVNSYTLLDQADEIVAQHPDAVLIYTGHNEYYGAFGVASTRALGHWPPLVRAYLALHRLRTVQLAENVLGGRGDASTSANEGSANEASAPATVMELMAGDQRIALGSPRYEQGLAQFRSNLEALLARYEAHRIPVFIGTLVSNERDQRPFISGYASPADSIAWTRSASDAGAALERGDSVAALALLRAAARAHDATADAHYALARLLDAAGQYDSARVHYRAARERDELRFRAPEALNRIIREEAARHRDVIVVESERAFEQASPHGIVGHSLVLEHLHPNVDGYYLLADAFLRALGQSGRVGSSPSRTDAEAAAERAEAPVTPVDSVAGWLRIDRLLSGWPFQPRGATVLQAVDTLRPRDEVERLAQALVRGTVSWPEAMDRQRAWFEQRGDVDDAIRVARAMALEYRYTPQPLMDAARIALAAHDYERGLRFARDANARRETPENAELVGLLLLREGDDERAMPFLERATQLAPTDRTMRGALAAARMLPRLRDRRAVTPRDTTVLYDVAVAYTLTQQFDSAREALAALQRVAPGSTRARALLASLPK